MKETASISGDLISFLLTLQSLFYLMHILPFVIVYIILVVVEIIIIRFVDTHHDDMMNVYKYIIYFITSI
jgi:hypothetical protein